MVLTPIIRVQALGWTHGTIESAIRQLSVATDAEDQGALGRELLQQLRRAPQDSIGTLAFDLNAPSLDDTNLWKALLRPKGNDGIGNALEHLRAQFPEPHLVAILRELLIEVSGGDVSWRALENEGHRLVEALLVIGTSEKFLLERYSLLTPDEFGDFERIRRLVHLHRRDFQMVGGEVWRSLAWSRRTSLIMWFIDVELSIDSIVEALLDIDTSSLESEARTHYVEALGVASPFDERLLLPIHDLLDQAFSSPQPNDADWVNFVRRALVNLRGHTTEDERRCAALYGLANCVGRS